MNGKQIRVLGLCLSLLASVSAWTLEPPRGQVLLTIDGNVTVTNAGGEARFDRAMLEAMPQETITTKATWIEGKQPFVGPRVIDVLRAVGADGQAVRAKALDGYAIDIPLEILEKGGILAMSMSGQTLTRRTFGPLWIVFQKDDEQDRFWEKYWVWQLEHLTVL